MREFLFFFFFFFFFSFLGVMCRDENGVANGPCQQTAMELQKGARGWCPASQGVREEL